MSGVDLRKFTEENLLAYIRKNPTRDVEAFEPAIDFKVPPAVVQAQLDALVNKGVLAKRHWGKVPDITVVYGLPEVAAVDQPAAA